MRSDLKEFITEALQDKVTNPGEPGGGEPHWMKGFGKLRALRTETARIQKHIDEVFEVIEPEDRR